MYHVEVLEVLPAEGGVAALAGEALGVPRSADGVHERPFDRSAALLAVGSFRKCTLRTEIVVLVQVITEGVEFVVT